MNWRRLMTRPPRSDRRCDYGATGASPIVTRSACEEVIDWRTPVADPACREVGWTPLPAQPRRPSACQRMTQIHPTEPFGEWVANDRNGAKPGPTETARYWRGFPFSTIWCNVPLLFLRNIANCAI